MKKNDKEQFDWDELDQGRNEYSRFSKKQQERAEKQFGKDQRNGAYYVAFGDTSTKPSTQNFLVTLAVLTLALYGTSALFSSFEIESFFSAFILALVFSIFDAVLKPFLYFLLLIPIILTFGLFIWFVNAFILYLSAQVVPGVEATSYFAMLFASVVLSVFRSALMYVVNSFDR